MPSYKRNGPLEFLERVERQREEVRQDGEAEGSQTLKARQLIVEDSALARP